MATETKLSFGEEMFNSIKLAIQKEVEYEYDRKKKELIEEIDRRKVEVCAGVLLHVMEVVNMNVSGRDVIFTIRKTEKSGNE